VLKTFTAWLAVVFFASCIILSLWTAALGRSKQVETSQFPIETLE
jgi:preprotein translocase subunit SecG